MRVVFIGTVAFSRRTLVKLIELNVNIVGVITKEKSEFNSDFTNLIDICVENNIKYKYVNDINHPNNVAWIRQIEPDVLFCFGWSSLLKAEILSLAPLGVIGYHPALLPANRGRHPIIWALTLGLDRTGSTFFFMDECADTGDIISQKVVEISKQDDAASLYDKLIIVALDQIAEFVPQLISGNYPRLKQTGKGNTWRKRGKKDGEIDWRMSSESISNLVRALTKPYPGAQFIYRSNEYKVWKCIIESVGNCKNYEPGKILQIDKNKILIKTGDNAIWLTDFEAIENVVPGDYLR